jgi:hypothetical protein
MNLKTKLQNPYFKVANCTDLADLDHAISEIQAIVKEHPKSIRAKYIYAKLWEKKQSIKHQNFKNK